MFVVFRELVSCSSQVLLDILQLQEIKHLCFVSQIHKKINRSSVDVGDNKSLECFYTDGIIAVSLLTEVRILVI